jgi:hypothetical protein
MKITIPAAKPLPEAVKSVSVGYDYGLVKFRRKREGYHAHDQLAEFQVV